MTAMQTARDEITEALGPLETWRFAAAIERTTDLNAACQDALTTLMWWGWSITVTRPKGEWTIQAAKVTGSRTIRARGQGGDYYTATYQLRSRLLATLSGEDGDEEAEAA